MSMAIKHAMNKRKVKSGNTGGNDTPYYGKNNVQPDVSRGNWGGGADAGTSLAGEHVRGAKMAKENGQHKAHASRTESAKNLHKEAISNLKNDKGDRTNLAEGGEVTDPQPSKADDMASSMRKAFNFAGGGDVDCMACRGGTCMEHGGLVDRIMKKRGSVEEAPNDFDELDVEPAPEADYPGSNEHGDAELDENDHDLISRIMRSRAKKDRMPRPA